jgi:hypothetical protein
MAFLKVYFMEPLRLRNRCSLVHTARLSTHHPWLWSTIASHTHQPKSHHLTTHHLTYTTICVPISTTRSDGIWK